MHSFNVYSYRIQYMIYCISNILSINAIYTVYDILKITLVNWNHECWSLWRELKRFYLGKHEWESRWSERRYFILAPSNGLNAIGKNRCPTLQNRSSRPSVNCLMNSGRRFQCFINWAIKLDLQQMEIILSFRFATAYSTDGIANSDDRLPKIPYYKFRFL